MRGNKNPSQKLKPLGDQAFSKTPLSAKVPLDVEEYVRAQPIGVAEWVRRAIIEKKEREQAKESSAA